MQTAKPKIFRLVLGDQLNCHHSWFKEVDDSVRYVLMEIRTETDYAKHHIQKVLGFFAAMRQFALELQSKGHSVTYIRLSDAKNLQDFSANLHQLIIQEKIEQFEYQLPDEYRVDEHLKAFCNQLTIPYNVYDTEHFYTTRQSLAQFFEGKKTYLMESFYRHMRLKHRVLITSDNQPLHGKWNFDASNRKKLPEGHLPIEPLVFNNDVSQIEAELASAGVKTIGSVNSQQFIWPVSRTQALQLMHFFAKHCLLHFGSFQDAMLANVWSLYHSRLSFAINVKLISPSEVIEAAINAYQQNPETIAFHQLEGFIRQIIGWREYMRGIYWMKMPDYAELNYFEHRASLPQWYWTSNTRMHCLRQCISQSLEHAYAHHIQRLMVTGNFALLAGVHPDEVDAWYLGIYIDALQWVEITNTRGMSQFADGGIVGTKPYVSSASYINKMSNYCSGCYYDKDAKVGEKACPFNSLFWNFYHQHRTKLQSNPRVSMMYSVWDKMQSAERTAILNQAAYYLEHIDRL